MLYLQSISLLQFKNYPGANFHFNSRIIAVCGRNGKGKTNLLDSVYYLCFTKSYFTRTDSQNVNSGSSGFRIEGIFNLENETAKVVCILRETGKKEFSVNDNLYEKFSSHIGRFPCVIIAPDDVQIITDISEERRRFLDALLSQTDSGYLQQLIGYNRVLQQRNSYLRTLVNGTADQNLMDVYNSQLSKYGTFIFNKRREFLTGFLPVVQSFYERIAATPEKIDITYKSQLLNTLFPDLLKQLHEKDILLQRSSGGIHRDDLEFRLNGQAFKNIASQGQRKSLLFALKLAEFETLKQVKGFAPLLLLDDVFEKLDADRMHNLLNWVCLQNEGQIFITDTHKERVSGHLEKLEVGFQLINLE